ncbi:MAG: hypothetical protein JXR88_09275 [Clostridia bacterium]|nr:hypothetical protein [Clostridia bacterium]
MKHSFRFKFTVISIVIASVAALIMTIIGSLNAIEYENNQKHEYIYSLGQQYKLQIDGFLKYQKGYLNGQVQGLSNSGDYSPEYVSAYIKLLDQGNPFILYSYFNTLTDEGHFTSSDGWIPPKDYSWEKRLWVSRVAELNDVYVDWPSYDSGTGEIVEVLRKRVVYNNEVIGILNMAIHLRELSETVDSYFIPDHGYAILMDPDGLLISYPNFQDHQTSDQAPYITDIESSFGTDINEFEIKASFKYDGMEYIHVPLTEAPWHLYLVVPDSYFTKGVSQIYLQYILLYFIMCVFIFILTNFISRRVMQPLTKLTSYSGAIANGDYNLSIDESLKNNANEIGRFAIQFDQMAKEIQRRESQLVIQKNEIEDLNKNLEQKITLRTQELQKSNQELNQMIIQLEKAQKTLVESESLNLQSRLISGISHELNTPIGTAITSLSYLHSKTSEMLDHLDNNHLKKSELNKYFSDNLNALLQLLNYLTAASDIVQSIRMISGAYMTSTTRIVQLDELINTVIHSVQNLLEESKVEIHLDVLPLELSIVPAAFSKVLVSIIENTCIHAYDDGGPLYISVKKEEMISIDIWDEGIGSKESDLFEPFSTSKREQGYKGLGLSLVKNLVINTLKGQINIIPSERGLHLKIQLPDHKSA